MAEIPKVRVQMSIVIMIFRQHWCSYSTTRWGRRASHTEWAKYNVILTRSRSGTAEDQSIAVRPLTPTPVTGRCQTQRNIEAQSRRVPSTILVSALMWTTHLSVRLCIKRQPDVVVHLDPALFCTDTSRHTLPRLRSQIPFF